MIVYPQVIREIFRLIKAGDGKPLTQAEIEEGTHRPPEYVVPALEEMIKSGWIVESGGKYSLKFFLDPPLSKDSREKKVGDAWEYESILLERLSSGGLQIESAEPFVNPFKKYLPHGWSQNGRGTCTGHAGAIFMQCNYYACTKDFPSDDEMKGVKFNVQKSLGSCVLTYDSWYRTIFSAQWIYHIGRVFGNVKYPSGGYTKAVVGAMKEYGAVPWDTCLTPKAPDCAPLTYPLSFEETKARAVGHKIDGYAVITTFEGVMDAIENSPAHCVAMATNLEEDYQHPSGGDVWKVHVGAPKAGSHALPWVFVDRARGMIGCWNSWGSPETGGFVQTCWIDKRFWQENCSPAYVPLDKEEAIIGRDIFMKVTLTANIPCSFLVSDGKTETKYTGIPVLSLERGISYHITAIPLDPAKAEEPALERTVIYLPDEAREKTEAFSFTLRAKPRRKTVAEMIAELFAKIFGRK